MQQGIETLSFVSCTNNVTLTYHTTANSGNEFRGFRAYFESILRYIFVKLVIILIVINATFFVD